MENIKLSKAASHKKITTISLLCVEGKRLNTRKSGFQSVEQGQGWGDAGRRVNVSVTQEKAQPGDHSRK